MSFLIRWPKLIRMINSKDFLKYFCDLYNDLSPEDRKKLIEQLKIKSLVDADRAKNVNNCFITLRNGTWIEEKQQHQEAKDNLEKYEIILKEFKKIDNSNIPFACFGNNATVTFK